MTPTNTAHEVRNLRLAEPEAGGNGFLFLSTSGRSTDGVDGACCEFYVPVAQAGCRPTLLSHVPRVVCGTAEKQMAWANARGVVAPMQDATAGGNLAEVNLPGEAMGERLLGVLVAQHPVACGHPAAYPEPAALGLLDPGPEPLSERSPAVVPNHRPLLYTVYHIKRSREEDL